MRLLPDYYHCPWCGGYIVGLSPQKKEYEVAARVGCGRPGCDPDHSKQKKLGGEDEDIQP